MAEKTRGAAEKLGLMIVVTPLLPPLPLAPFLLQHTPSNGVASVTRNDTS